jgi:hypothetical protein
METDLAIQIAEMQAKLDMLMLYFNNHLTHHFWYTTFAYTVMAGLIVTLSLYIIKQKKNIGPTDVD